MASISKDKRGNRTVQFVGPDKRRRSVRLGKTGLAEAKAIAAHVDHLASCWKHRKPPCKQTDDWVAGLLADSASHWLYDRLAAVKLVPERERPEDQVGELSRLGAFLAAYIEGRTDLKPGTVQCLRQVEGRLVEFFGQDKPLAEITPADADDFRRWLETKLGDNTVRRYCGRAKQYFHAAVRRRLIDRDTNPFADMTDVNVRPNRERDFFITRDIADQVLEACPDLEWRLLFSLSRYGGLRCPSEHLALTWSDVDWERDRIIIRSPKTERHEGKESRVIPFFPELKGLLEQAFDEAPDGAVHVIQRYRDCNANLRTQLQRIIRRASPTRTRTRNTSVETRHDHPFHHRAIQAEGMGFEPTSPSGGTH
jgi:integrase